MATIHPSRMGLVPQDSKSSDSRRGRSRSPQSSRRYSPRRPRSRDGNYGRNERKDRDRQDRTRDKEDGRERRERPRADDYFDGSNKGRGRSRSLDRQRDREREERRDGDRQRRPSPEYAEYKRPASGERDGAPNNLGRQQDNMYPSRVDRMPFRGGGGQDFLESRREQRESSTLSIWPPSPKGPARSSHSPDSRRHKKSKKRRRSSTPTDSSDSEDERQRRERKERKKAKKEREKEKEKSRRYRENSSDDEEDRRHRRKRRSRSRPESEERRRSADRSHRSKTRTQSPNERPPTSGDEDEWVEKPTASTFITTSATNAGSSMGPPAIPSSSANGSKTNDMDEGSDDEVGPQPLVKINASSKKVDERQYGGALLKGEGSAMAAFLKDGTDVRIPRRGEIGLTSNEIATFETVGYVMSGSRHRRMNAVRMRKENQVISAEEKRGILKLQQEERERREAILREEFEELVNEKLKAQGGPK